MKNIILLAYLFLIVSCGKDKVIQLPEITTSEISELHDVSAAYLFYDETKIDSIELNRKNLISTTNWLFNVDKRLTLKQALPKIKFLQEKRRNAEMHKNENAKNYYTCNDIEKKNLGFIEFTDIVYHEESSETYILKISELKNLNNMASISFHLNGDIAIINPNSEPFIISSNKNKLLTELKKMDTIDGSIYLNFNKNLTFQDYILYKSILSKPEFKTLKISNQEFLHN